MSLDTALKHVATHSAAEVSAIVDFVKFVESAIADTFPKIGAIPLSHEDSTEIKDFAEAIANAYEKIDINDELPKKLKIVKRWRGSKKLGDLVLGVAIPIKRQTFLSEMTLIQLMTYQEAFIKDILLQAFLHRRVLLRSAASVTIQELSQHSSIESLWTMLALREVESVGFGSIDDTAAYFDKRFNVSLETLPGWVAVREASYRRNLVVHNQGKVNAIYRKKLGLPPSAKPDPLSLEYNLGIANALLEFIAATTKALRAKLR